MYRIRFALRQGVTVSERDRILTSVISLDVHPESVSVWVDGSGEIVYDEPIDADEREMLVAWLAEHPLVARFTECDEKPV